MLKFLIDESTGKRLADFLKQKGFDAVFVADAIQGATDEQVLEFAEKQNRILITNDKDFGELIFRQKKLAHGIILLRLKNDSHKNRQEFVSLLLKTHQDKLNNSFVVLTEGKVRIRRI